MALSKPLIVVVFLAIACSAIAQVPPKTSATGMQVKDLRDKRRNVQRMARKARIGQCEITVV